ncbi:MAG: hypothetical protein HQM08_29595 [Candidatus Riflebacteria bacterium]|nr:hypothetical protein [Candidatus Riflebacteria bacterium]
MRMVFLGMLIMSVFCSIPAFCGPFDEVASVSVETKAQTSENTTQPAVTSNEPPSAEEVNEICRNAHSAADFVKLANQVESLALRDAILLKGAEKASTADDFILLASNSVRDSATQNAILAIASAKVSLFQEVLTLGKRALKEMFSDSLRPFAASDWGI